MAGKQEVIERLKKIFEKLIPALQKITELEAVRDQAKSVADTEFEKASAKYQTVVSELNPEAEQLFLQHQDELLVGDKRSLKIGTATVGLKKGKPLLLTDSEESQDEEIDWPTLVEALVNYRARTQSQEVRDLIDGVIETKPTAKREKVKELPASVLKVVGVKLVQRDQFYIKANAER